MAENKKTIKKQILPVLPLRGLTVFPEMELHFDIGREVSVKALEEAMMNDQNALLVTQRDAGEENPGPDDLYTVGTISRVKQLVRLSKDTIRVRVEGINRAQIVRFTQGDPYFAAEVIEKTYLYPVKGGARTEALLRQVHEEFEEYVKLNNKVAPEVVMRILNLDDTSRLSDAITANIFLKAEAKQELLEIFNPIKRLEKLLGILIREIEIMSIEREIGAKVRKQIDKSQRDYYLREQVKTIQNELGDKDGIAAEVEEYRERIAQCKLPEEVEKKALKEVDKLSKMQAGFAEGTVVRNYLDWILDLPWTFKTDERLDIEVAKAVLDEDHYGLEKVKERILEYLAIRVNKSTLKGPIICLVGPPGVGKTSVAKSVARALNRNYVRVSLGGVRDEAEIRGHRRTYVGAIPGRIITSLKQAGSMNPLLLLDEIDKMNSDFRGDPASAMLEVLDGEQNFAFHDHYIELPYDLSEVLFITTANNADTIPRPLLDRMEVIEVSSYTEEEKVRIALDFLIPKQLKAHGVSKRNVLFDETAVRDLINYYTRESGVRTLEREIASVTRKAIKYMVTNKKKSVRINRRVILKFLGVQKYRHEPMEKSSEIGVARGLAWTAVGGETLSVEANVMKGSGKLELTGQLGDVMQESAKAAVSFIRSRADKLGIEEDFYSRYDIHIHVPEGATPKDGPSAGITLASALVSALARRPVRKNIAMTGEITLRGRVLPIGGLKEKVLAAHRAGIDTIIMPIDNEKDIEEIPEQVKLNIRFVPVSSMDEVLSTALMKPLDIVVSQETEKAGVKKVSQPDLIFENVEHGIQPDLSLDH